MIAIYPGTFDPFTNGHFDLLKRALKIFPNIVIAVANNSNKSVLLDIDERATLIGEICQEFKGVEVRKFEGLLIDFAHDIKANVILRGLRAVSDFEYEIQLAAMNRNLAPDVETMFLTPSEKYSFISSSLIKDVVRLKGDAVGYLHPAAISLLKAKMR